MDFLVDACTLAATAKPTTAKPTTAKPTTAKPTTAAATCDRSAADSQRAGSIPDDEQTAEGDQTEVAQVEGDAATADVEPDGQSNASAGEVAIGVIITASIETLEGLSNEPGMVGETVTDAATIRALAADRRWARGSLYDRRGITTSLGRKVRFPNKAQRIAIGVRHPKCVFPGCARPATASDIDHNKAWHDGGRTDLSNLFPLCTLHHHLKHQPDWTCHARRDGSLLWTLPHGQTIIVQPHDHRPPPGPHDRTNTELDLRQRESENDAQHYAWLAWALNNDPGELSIDASG